jgi:hypothetical protein
MKMIEGIILKEVGNGNLLAVPTLHNRGNENTAGTRGVTIRAWIAQI